MSRVCARVRASPWPTPTRPASMRSWDHLGHPGPASVEGIETADFALAVDLNLRSQIVTLEAALPELRARGGSPLYTASTLGLAGLAWPGRRGPPTPHSFCRPM